MIPKNEFISVIDPEGHCCWAARLDDGSLILMDRDMRIIDNTPWQHAGMGFSGCDETLEDYVYWWLDREWVRANAGDPDDQRTVEELRQLLTSKLPDF